MIFVSRESWTRILLTSFCDKEPLVCAAGAFEPYIPWALQPEPTYRDNFKIWNALVELRTSIPHLNCYALIH
jgi:hypothetical protein